MGNSPSYSPGEWRSNPTKDDEGSQGFGGGGRENASREKNANKSLEMFMLYYYNAAYNGVSGHLWDAVLLFVLPDPPLL